MNTLSKYGAKPGEPGMLIQWFSKIAAPDLVIFPVPGDAYFRSKGIFLDRYFKIAGNPREANVLLVAGMAGDSLAKKMAVAYIQMPRPRALVFAGIHDLDPLPEPDIRTGLNEESIAALKNQLASLFKNPYRKDATGFHPHFIEKMLDDDEKNNNQHQHGHHGHGNGEEQHEHAGGLTKDEHAGHEHEEHRDQADHDHKKNEDHHQGDHANKGNHGHEHHHNNEKDNPAHQGHEHQHQHEGQDHKKETDQEKHGHREQNHEEQDQNEHKHEHHGNGGHNHEGGMGFMSMVMMTKDMPCAADGLPMERNMTWFGPFFPGLPGGLAFKFHLDGDTVIKTEVNRDLFFQDSIERRFSESGDFCVLLSEVNPLNSAAGCILGEQLWKKSNGKSADLTAGQAILLERERINSHLNWLAGFSVLVGNHGLRIETLTRMYRFQHQSDYTALEHFTRSVAGFRYLKRKLRHAGAVPDILLHHASGPVTRSAGRNEDVRSSENIYHDAGFEMLLIDENNVWGRLKLRMMEIGQSLKILKQLEKYKMDAVPQVNQQNKKQIRNPVSVCQEGPSGFLEAGTSGGFKRIEINSASAIHASLAELLVKEMELSDALLTLASLDLNPYTMKRIIIDNRE